MLLLTPDWLNVIMNAAMIIKIIITIIISGQRVIAETKPLTNPVKPYMAIMATAIIHRLRYPAYLYATSPNIICRYSSKIHTGNKRNV